MKEYTATALVPVQFHGQTLVTTQHNGEPHVAMRPIVEAMGLDWQAQLQRIKRHPVLAQGVVIVSYKEVPAANFTEVLSLVARLPIKSDSPPPFLQGEIGTRVLVRLEGGCRYSVTPLAITETVVDLADLVAIDQALDAWRDFAKRKELSYYRAGVANLRSNGH
jgi:hypothetical protein